MDRPEIIIFIPTNEEYQILSNALSDLGFTKFNHSLVLTGSGHQATFNQINTTLTQRNAGPDPLLLLGAGSCTALNPEFSLGHTLASCVAIFAPDDQVEKQQPGLNFQGKPDTPGGGLNIDDPVTCKCSSSLSRDLVLSLRIKGFFPNPTGTLPTPDSYQKLKDTPFKDCLTCDLESAAVAQGATRANLPWINIRMVTNIFDPEQPRPPAQPQLLEDLALKMTVALSTLDKIPLSTTGCGSCTSCRPFG